MHKEQKRLHRLLKCSNYYIYLTNNTEEAHIKPYFWCSLVDWLACKPWPRLSDDVSRAPRFPVSLTRDPANRWFGFHCCQEQPPRIMAADARPSCSSTRRVWMSSLSAHPGSRPVACREPRWRRCWGSVCRETCIQTAAIFLRDTVSSDTLVPILLKC